MQGPTWQKSPKQIAFPHSHSVPGFSIKCECRTRTKQRIKLIMLAVFRVHLQTLCCVPPIHYLTSSTGFFMGATMLNMQTLKLKLLLVKCLTRCYKYCDSEGREFPPFFCLPACLVTVESKGLDMCMSNCGNKPPNIYVHKANHI